MRKFLGASVIAATSLVVGLTACGTSPSRPTATGSATQPGTSSVATPSGAAPRTTAPGSVAPSSSPTPTPRASGTWTPPPGATAAPSSCTIGANLVPTCGILWGAAAGGFTKTPRDQALKDWEKTSGQGATIYHAYHSGDQLFPTKDEIAMAHQTDRPRLLLLNWKVDAGTTWAKVAAGAEDKRIDREAAYLKKTFTDRFFLVLHHEPENDVNPVKGSGRTAADFASMFRHTVKRMRADGVTNAVTVVAFMNYEKWNNTSWWPDLYPGDDVVDWIAVNSYLNADPGAFHHGDFASMVNRTTDAKKFPGFYNWATSKHPTKPVMLAEWGVYGTAADKAAVFDTVLPELPRFPAIYAMVYFDTPKDQAGRDIRINSTASSTAAFRKIAGSLLFRVDLPAP
jgi:beta-mannanase